MSTDEQRGYTRGYAAGRRKAKQERSRRQLQAQRQAFTDRAFLALLPVVFAPEFNWGVEKDGKHVPYRTDKERIDFAWEEARNSLNRRPYA